MKKISNSSTTSFGFIVPIHKNMVTVRHELAWIARNSNYLYNFVSVFRPKFSLFLSQGYQFQPIFLQSARRLPLIPGFCPQIIWTFGPRVDL